MSASYYVHFVDDNPPIVHGPYPGTAEQFKKTKMFALIGSRYGGRRVITRGREGPTVRVYERGYRQYPRGKRLINKLVKQGKLKSYEKPREMTPRVPKALGWAANPLSVYVEPTGEPGVQQVFFRGWPLGYIYFDRPSYRWVVRAGMQEMGFPASGDGYDAALEWLYEQGHPDPGQTISLRARKNPPWSSADTDELVKEVAKVVWAQNLLIYSNYAAEDHEVPFGWIGFVMHQLGDEVPASAKTDARRFLTALKKANGDVPWYEVANALGVEDDDLDTFAYYVAMQTMGAGPTWGDSRPGELVTGYDEGINSSSSAEYRVGKLVEQLQGR